MLLCLTEIFLVRTISEFLFWTWAVLLCYM
jgi:hypothetical protein